MSKLPFYPDTCCHCGREGSEELKIRQLPILFADPEMTICEVCDDCLAVTYYAVKTFLEMGGIGMTENELLDRGFDLLQNNNEALLKRALSQVGGKCTD